MNLLKCGFISITRFEFISTRNCVKNPNELYILISNSILTTTELYEQCNFEVDADAKRWVQLSNNKLLALINLIESP